MKTMTMSIVRVPEMKWYEMIQSPKVHETITCKAILEAFCKMR